MLSEQVMVRMSGETRELLGLVARVQGRSRQDVVREALDRYLHAEVADGMVEHLRSRRAAERALADRLAR